MSQTSEQIRAGILAAANAPSTDMRAELIRTRRGPEKEEMYTGSQVGRMIVDTKTAAVAEAQKQIVDEAKTLNDRLRLQAELGAVEDWSRSPQEAVESVLSTHGVEGARQLVDALKANPYWSADAEALGGTLDWVEANRHLSFQQARETAAAEDERLHIEAQAERFVRVADASSPEIRERMQELDRAVDATPLVVHGMATADVLAERNAALKARIVGSTPNRFASRGNRNVVGETDYIPSVERERERLIRGNPDVPDEDLVGDQAPRLKVVPSNPEVRTEIEKELIRRHGVLPGGGIREWQGRK